MKPQHSHSTILLPLLALAANLHTLYLPISSPQNPISDHVGFLIWWGCLILTYGVLTLLLRRPRSIGTVILTAAGGFCLQLVLTLISPYHPSTVLGWFLLLFMWIGLYGRCCTLLLEGTQSESVVTSFEFSVVMLFISAIGVSISVMPPDLLSHPAAGLLLSFIAMVRVRIGHARVDTQARTTQKGRFLPAVILLGIGGSAALFCALLSGACARLLTGFTQRLFSLLRSVLQLVGRFFRWLASLHPEQHVDSELLEDPSQSLPIGNAEWGSMESELPLYLMIAGVTLLALLGLVLLWRCGGIHRLSVRSHTVSRTTRSRHSLRQLLQTYLQKFRRWFAFRISSLKLRNTAPGLFVWLERQMHIHHLDRQAGETARAFLMRTQTALPSCSEILTRLADCLDQHYFGAGQTLSSAEISAMRRQLRTEFHHQSTKKVADK